MLRLTRKEVQDDGKEEGNRGECLGDVTRAKLGGMIYNA